jgi:nucleoside diphosphate kinase
VGRRWRDRRRPPDDRHTKPLDAAPGTIRGDLGINIGRIVIHGSAKDSG